MLQSPLVRQASNRESPLGFKTSPRSLDWPLPYRSSYLFLLPPPPRRRCHLPAINTATKPAGSAPPSPDPCSPGHSLVPVFAAVLQARNPGFRFQISLRSPLLTGGVRVENDISFSPARWKYCHLPWGERSACVRIDLCVAVPLFSLELQGHFPPSFCRSQNSPDCFIVARLNRVQYPVLHVF